MDMLKKIAIKEIIEENRELRDCNDTYKYIIEKALNINDRLISEIAIREEEIELLKREKEEQENYIDSLTDELVSKDEEIILLKQEFETLKKINQESYIKNRLLEEENKKLKKDICLFDFANSYLKNALKDSNDKYNKLVNNIETLRKKYSGEF